MIIRKAKLDDIDNNLLNIFMDGLRFHSNNRPDFFNRKKTNNELKNELIKIINENEKEILIMENHKIIGFIMISLKNKHGKVLWIDQVVVDKNERNKGIATKLINKAKEIAQEKECDRLELGCWCFNENANRLYKNIGFKQQRTIYEIELK